MLRNQNASEHFKLILFDFHQGLFEMDDLTSPEGFAKAQGASIKEAEELVNEAIQSPTSADIVVIFDKLSDSLCRIADLVSTIRRNHQNQ